MTVRNIDAERRKKENEDLIARMKRGESLARCSTQDTWWQPRPIIKKDKKLIAQAFGDKPTKDE
jgi:hypothetical protein